MMDSNKKGKYWVGSICNQFEDFFQDVDDFVTKGTVKYVENQVHNVGVSVKKFYSDVQDKLPPVLKNVKEQKTSPIAKQINVTEDQLVMEESSIDPLRANESTTNGHHAQQITKLPLTDPSQEKISDLPSGKDDDATTWNEADYGFGDYFTGDLTPESANTNSDKKISETCVDHDTFIPPMAASPAISISNAEIPVIRKEIFDGFFDDKESRSNISADGWLFEDELLPIFKPSDPDEIEAHEENSLAVDPLHSSACNVGHVASIEEDTCCDSFTTEDACVDISYTPQSTEFMFLYFSSSTCSASPKTSNIVEFASEDFTHKVEKISNDHIDSSRHASPKASATVELISEDFTHKVENICNDHIESNGHASPKASATVELISEDFTHKVENICNDHIESNGHASPKASATVELISEDFTHKVENICNDHIESNGHASPKASATVEFISEDFTHKVDFFCNDHIDSSGHASPKASATVEFISEDTTHKVENICNDNIEFNGHASPKASTNVEFISEDNTHKVENICNDHIESNGHACTSSTPSCTTLAYETEAMDRLPLMDSNDVISSATSESVSIVGSCQSRREHCQEDAHSKYYLTPSKIGSSVEFGVDVMDCEMETVDLSDTVTHDKKNLLLNCNFAHPRSRDFRYYKNLIQDAIVSRKRLSKEYEHLGILYGDIDMESKLNFEPSSSHSCPKSVDVSECDWELL